MLKYLLTAKIYHRNELLIEASNKYKTCPLQHYYKSNNWSTSTHAEVAVVDKYLKIQQTNYIKGRKPLPSLKDCLMVVTRMTRKGEYALAKPCEGCTRLIMDYSLATKYSTPRGYDGYLDLEGSNVRY